MDSTDRHVQALLQEMTDWRSVNIVVHTVQNYHIDFNNDLDRGVVDYTYIEQGDSRYSETSIPAQGKLKRTSKKAGYADGDRFFKVESESRDGPLRQTQVAILPGFLHEQQLGLVDRPIPLQMCWYVGLKPIYEALPGGEPLGEGEALGRSTDLYRFRVTSLDRAHDLVYSLDRATSVPLKVEKFADAAARDRGETEWVWEALSLDEVQSYHLPLRSRERVYKHGPEVRAKPVMTIDFDVTQLEFDREFPASTFTPVLEPGVPVADVPGGKYLRVSKDGQSFVEDKGEVPAPPATVTATPPAGSPLTAEPPGSGWQVGTATGLGLGAAVLGAAALLWWRRR